MPLRLAWPDDSKLSVKTLAQGSEKYPKEIAKIELLGGGELPFSRHADALVVQLPETRPNKIAAGLKITPK